MFVVFDCILGALIQLNILHNKCMKYNRYDSHQVVKYWEKVVSFGLEMEQLFLNSHSLLLKMVVLYNL